jgi:hypothetical protein
MRRTTPRQILLSASLFAAACGAACGQSSPDGGFYTGSGAATSSGGNSSGGSSEDGGPGGGSGPDPGLLGGDNGGMDAGSTLPPSAPIHAGDAGGIACPSGLQCNVTCSGSGTTSISGTVYDPAGKNPVYNVAVYVPAVPLVPLPAGVPTGADACSCGALFQSGALTNTTTAVDGTFTLNNVPVGTNVPLVLQVGKWRRLVHVNVSACTNNAQAQGSLTLPGSIPAGDTDDNMPDIAVSTGFADTLECLMLRMGLPASEFVPGAGAGHVHVFTGGDPLATAGAAFNGLTSGAAEVNPMPGAPPSSSSLWSSAAQLMPYDIVLLSCEGGETFSANPSALESYLNAGGRTFASHYHYAWFSGPIESAGINSYSAPSDWGTNLATWSSGENSPDPTVIGGIVDTTLNGSSSPFPKGTALSQWLSDTGALGQNGVAAGELSIYQPRFNATVTPSNAPSQPWITADSTSGASGSTMYFSFDTPIDPAASADGGAGDYCGRAVFSDLHVSGDPSESDSENVFGGQPAPAGCSATDLSPQEKALEFMLFDLSSCVLPDTVAVPVDAGLPPPPTPPATPK